MKLKNKCIICGAATKPPLFVTCNNCNGFLVIHENHLCYVCFIIDSDRDFRYLKTGLFACYDCFKEERK